MKKIYLKTFIPDFLDKPPWGKLLESCMPNLIELARLESCQKSGEVYGWMEGEERKKKE